MPNDNDYKDCTIINQPIPGNAFDFHQAFYHKETLIGVLSEQRPNHRFNLEITFDWNKEVFEMIKKRFDDFAKTIRNED